MRLAIAVLFVCTLSPACAQSNRAHQPPSPKIPDEPPGFALPNTDFGKLPQRQCRINPNMPLVGTFKAPPATLRPLGDAQIDPKIIIRPAQSRLEDQPAGTMIAQNQFPGLRFLPIGGDGSKLEPIPIRWPNLKTEPIPTQCANCAVAPVEGHAAK